MHTVRTQPEALFRSNTKLIQRNSLDIIRKDPNSSSQTISSMKSSGEPSAGDSTPTSKTKAIVKKMKNGSRLSLYQTVVRSSFFLKTDPPKDLEKELAARRARKKAAKAKVPKGWTMDKHEQLENLVDLMLLRQEKNPKKMEKAIRRKSCDCTWCGGLSTKEKKWEMKMIKESQKKEDEPEVRFELPGPPMMPRRTVRKQHTMIIPSNKTVSPDDKEQGSPRLHSVSKSLPFILGKVRTLARSSTTLFANMNNSIKSPSPQNKPKSPFKLTKRPAKSNRTSESPEPKPTVPKILISESYPETVVSSIVLQNNPSNPNINEKEKKYKPRELPIKRRTIKEKQSQQIQSPVQPQVQVQSHRLPTEKVAFAVYTQHRKVKSIVSKTEQDQPYDDYYSDSKKKKLQAKPPGIKGFTENYLSSSRKDVNHSATTIKPGSMRLENIKTEGPESVKSSAVWKQMNEKYPKTNKSLNKLKFLTSNDEIPMCMTEPLSLMETARTTQQGRSIVGTLTKMGEVDEEEYYGQSTGKKGQADSRRGLGSARILVRSAENLSATLGRLQKAYSPMMGKTRKGFL